MSEQPARKSRVTQRDVTKALKAAKAAGLDVGRVDIEPSGRIVLRFGEGQEAPLQPAPCIDDELARVYGPRQ